MKIIHILILILFSFTFSGCYQASQVPAPNGKKSITIEEEGLIVYFKSDFETQISPEGKEVTWFGPKGPQPGTEDYHLYSLRLVEKRTLEELMEEERINEKLVLFIFLSPTIIQINNFSVIKWAEAPFGKDIRNEVLLGKVEPIEPKCVTTYLELIGKENNIQFINGHGCHHDQETNFKYIENIIENIESI